MASRLNRRVEERPDGEPRMADFADSSALEFDADVAIILTTSSVVLKKILNSVPDTPETSDVCDVAAFLVKVRSGRRGATALRFDQPRYRFIPDPTIDRMPKTLWDGKHE